MIIDANTALLLGVGLCGLCVVGVVLLIGAQLLGIGFEIIGGILEFVFGVVGGNPCGCIVIVGMLVVCGGGVYLIATTIAACGTPDATNFCSLIGR